MQSLALELLKMRILVACLGEGNNNWWNTSFLNVSGQRYLVFNFPRTAFSAGLQSVTEAARKLHDERIGVGRVFHLFRLPMNLEEEIHYLQLRQDSDEDFAELMVSQESALDSLHQIAGNASVKAEGPVKAGGLQDLSKKEGLRQLAGYYYGAFKQGFQTFPYYQD
jgi:hypothetical protein